MYKWVNSLITGENSYVRSRKLFLDALEHNDVTYIQHVEKTSSATLNLVLDINGTMPVHVASEHGSFDVLVFLLEKCPEQLNQTDRFGKTPLFYAASHGHLTMVEYLIKRSAKLDTVVDDPSIQPRGLTPMISAMLCDHHQVVMVLFNAMELRQNILDQPQFYWIALKWAVEQNNAIVFASLLSLNGFNLLDIKEQVQLMSIAAQKGTLEVIQLLASRNQTLLAQPDQDGHPPLFWASYKGEMDFLEYLIQQGICVDQICNQREHPYFEKPMYLIAHERNHYAAANLIIHTLFNLGRVDNSSSEGLRRETNCQLPLESEQGIFDFINSGKAALEYCLLSPINARLIMKNQRLLTLIKTAGGHVTAKSIGLYKTHSTRRPSFFADINRATGEAEVYTQVSLLGKGANSLVREFRSLNQKKSIAIKSPKCNWQVTDHFDEEIHSSHREISFMRRAYGLGDTKESQVFSFNRRHDAEKNIFTLRTVMPCVGSTTVEMALRSIQPHDVRVRVLLAMTRALMLLHEKGIIHGDVKENNAIISNHNHPVNIVFVDFEYAYDINEEEATADMRGSYWAPERRVSEQGPVPHTSQDVYSFAVILDRVITYYPQGRDLIPLFPSILTFVQKGTHPHPERRPTLKWFYTSLSNELHRRFTSEVQH